MRPGKTRVLIHSDRASKLMTPIERAAGGAPIIVCDSYGGLAEALATFRPTVALTHKFEPRPHPASLLVSCPTLQWVQVGGTGVDHVPDWNPARLTVTNSAGATAEGMAEYAIGGLLALSLGLHDYSRLQRDARWQPRGIGVMRGKMTVVVGLGRIGQAVAALGRSVGMSIVGVSRSGAPKPGIEVVYPSTRLQEALRIADAVVVVVPKTTDTNGLLDAGAFGALKPGALLVDMSRGGVVDEGALLAALDAGAVRAALLDVFAIEPLPPQHPFWSHERVVVTPHAAGFVEGWEGAVAQMFAENLERWIAGAPLRNVVLPARRG